mmetsp:Transcript_16129/g.33886  ORF Transcript_16129/g.33886 Transcript_16129/m.33886 type:complete len:202 (-) Transcript_16129:350-955(-)
MLRRLVIRRHPVIFFHHLRRDPDTIVGQIQLIPQIQKGRLMHQLLGNAPHIDARPAQTPRRTGGTGFDVIQHGDFGPQRRGFFGGGEASGSAAEDEEVVVVGMVGRVVVRSHFGDGFGEEGGRGRGWPRELSASRATPFQGVVAAADEFCDRGGVEIGAGGEPAEGRRGVLFGLRARGSGGNVFQQFGGVVSKSDAGAAAS